MISKDFIDFKEKYEKKEVVEFSSKSSHKPLVSVCVQTYQHVSYIKDCLDGVLNQQTSFPFEILLGEDESNDGTREICIEIAEKFPEKIKLFLHHRKNNIHIGGKPSGRFNFMYNLYSAKGKYISICEGDDYWSDPLKLQKQVDLLEMNPELVGCHHWQKNAIEKDGVFVEIDSPKKGHGYFPQAVSKVVEIFSNNLRVKTRTVMFRNIIDKNFFPKWFENVAFGDVPLSFLLGKYGDFGFIDNEMAVYRQTETGVSNAGLKKLGRKAFIVQHFKNWIEIWDYADIHYKFEYHKEADRTVTEFYRTIISSLPISFVSLIKILWYNLFERRLNVFKTLTHTKLILLFYTKMIGGKIKRKLMFK